MGFLTFLKKKEPEVPKAPDFDLSSLNTDLPDVQGAKLEDDMNLPSMDDSISFSPTEDSMKLPSLDGSSIPDLTPFIPEPDTQPQNASVSPIPEDLSRDINQLFLSDPGWKEPDWKEFEPYTEEKIEPPTMHDFGIELPQPLVEMSEAEQPQSFEVPEFSDIEEHMISEDTPYDVFVKGVDYKRVFMEISEIKEILNEQDTKMSKVVETFKKEESTISICKENMDYLYKRMLTIDKKVFT